jgi:hypothetical protein
MKVIVETWNVHFLYLRFSYNKSNMTGATSEAGAA